jgi:hypothetical protein
MKFTALLHHLTVDQLRESSYSLKRKATPGVDGVTWQEYETGLEDEEQGAAAPLLVATAALFVRCGMALSVLTVPTAVQLL